MRRRWSAVLDQRRTTRPGYPEKKSRVKVRRPDLMAALIPGTSPPPVTTPRRRIRLKSRALCEHQSQDLEGALDEGSCKNPSPPEPRRTAAALGNMGQARGSRKLGPPALMSECDYVFRRFHHGQGDEDTEQRQPAGDVKGVDIAAEHILCLTRYEPGRDGADSIG